MISGAKLAVAAAAASRRTVASSSDSVGQWFLRILRWLKVSRCESVGADGRKEDSQTVAAGGRSGSGSGAQRQPHRSSSPRQSQLLQ